MSRLTEAKEKHARLLANYGEHREASSYVWRKRMAAVLEELDAVRQERDRYKDALVTIRAHQKLVAVNLYPLSQTYRIADKVLDGDGPQSSLTDTSVADLKE